MGPLKKIVWRINSLDAREYKPDGKKSLHELILDNLMAYDEFAKLLKLAIDSSEGNDPDAKKETEKLVRALSNDILSVDNAFKGVVSQAKVTIPNLIPLLANISNLLSPDDSTRGITFYLLDDNIVSRIF